VGGTWLGAGGRDRRCLHDKRAHRTTEAPHASAVTPIRGYWLREAGAQREVAVRMGQPIISADRVAVEWRTIMIDPDDDGHSSSGLLRLLRFVAASLHH
jgi:hypothetical protein